jgi:phosphate-selective porin
LGFAHGDITSANSSVQNNLILRDAMLFYDANKWVRIGFGQTKLPGNRQRLVSSANLQLVERSISNNNFTLDRDKGIWVYTNFQINKAVFKSTIAISSGEGRIVSDKNGKLCYSARAEFLPFGDFSKKGDYIQSDIEKEKKPKLSIAGVYSFNESSPRVMGQLGDYLYNSEIANIQYYGADLIFKYKGFSIESEFYTRNSNTGIITNIKESTQRNYIIAGNTFFIQSGIFITKKNEIAARYAQITPDNSVASVMNRQKEYVIGLSHYFNKHSLKLQSDVTYLINGDDKNLIYRLSSVVAF